MKQIKDAKTNIDLRSILPAQSCIDFPSQSFCLSVQLCETLIDGPTGAEGRGMDREGERERREKRERKNERKKERGRGEESSKVSSYLKNFSSLSVSLSSSSSLSLWCNSMCFTGPSWAEDLRWKTSEFLDVLKGMQGLNIFNVFWSVLCPLLDMTLERRSTLCLSVWLLFVAPVIFWCCAEKPALHLLSVKQL